ISVADVYNLGQEFFRWEIATAVAGAIIGINPFDQPDVEASKVATKKLTEEYERSGSLPAETPIFEGEGVKLFADKRNAQDLNSTGQAYKGGPNTGVFLQITCDDAIDLPVPGQKYTFGIVKAAQARGDFEVLAERGRRALRVHLGADVDEGLAILEFAVRAAFA